MTNPTSAAAAAKKPAAKPVAKAAAKPVAKTAAAKAVATKPAVKKPAAKATAKPVEAPATTDGDACALPMAAAVDGPKKRYKMLTGIDDSAFCQKVSDHLDDGYELYGSPAATFNGTNVIVAQAVVLKKLPKKHKRK